MSTFLKSCLLALTIFTGAAAERVFEFSSIPEGEIPAGFTNVLMGAGKPGEWKVVLDEVPPLLTPLTEQAASGKRGVLAQVSRDPEDNRYPMFMFENDVFGDFILATRFKLVGGAVEQMAGIAFRIQDPNNYYYIRASGKGNTFRFFKVQDGRLSPPIGVEMEFPLGKWHELKIEAKGNSIRTWINGEERIPTMTDSTFSSGKIAFWTKSDSVSYFADTRISYTPRESLARTLIRETMEKNPRLIAVKIYGKAEGKPGVQIIASTAEDIGVAGTAVEEHVISSGINYVGKKDSKVALVTMPLKDRNGEVVAAVRFEMESFRGQTDNNVLTRATPMVKEMEARIRASKDLSL